MHIVNSYEAKTQLSKLIDRALAGEKIVIARAGKPLVELTPVTREKRRLGTLAGKIRIPDDLDVPVKDVEDMFEHSEIPA